MTTTDLTIDSIVDNGDNTLTITGHDTNAVSHETNNGRKNKLPNQNNIQDSANIAYCQEILFKSIPPVPIVLYKNPDAPAKTE